MNPTNRPLEFAFANRGDIIVIASALFIVIASALFIVIASALFTVIASEARQSRPNL